MEQSQVPAHGTLKLLIHNHTFTGLGYTVSMADEGVFYKIDNDGYIIATVAMDGFTIITDSDKSVDLWKQQIRKSFEIMDLRPINWLLGIKITQYLERFHNLSIPASV